MSALPFAYSQEDGYLQQRIGLTMGIYTAPQISKFWLTELFVFIKVRHHLLVGLWRRHSVREDLAFRLTRRP